VIARLRWLARSAYVYVRQSTAYLVVNNLESQRRKYALVERARQLGWDDVQVVDDDLGKSGGGTRRPVFEKLLAAICEGRVGGVGSKVQVEILNRYVFERRAKATPTMTRRYGDRCRRSWR
jgi:DNA invertase Pin-like site-specific DNA recombinase